MKLNVKRKLIMVVVLSLVLSIFSTNSFEVKAAKPTDSIYTYAKELKLWYPAAKILKDNRGYYFTYKNNGYFEVYLGKSSTMSFSSFASKLGGDCNTKTTTKKITKTAAELKKLSVGALTAYLTKDVSNWKASFLIGVVSDKTSGALFREPGTYKFSVDVYTVKIRDGALK